MKSPDVIIVGGGVIGCAIARLLAQAGAGVLVIERGRPGAEASSAAAGMLSPLAEASEAGPFLNLLRHAREQFPRFVAELSEEVRVDIGYQDRGTLLVAVTAEDESVLATRFEWQSKARLPVERLSAAEVRDLEPAVSPEVRGALRFPEDHQVDNRSMTRALWGAAAQAGARFELGRQVTRLVSTAGRISGVGLADGDQLDGGAVVIAAGCWAGQLGGLPRPLPVFPVHGQLLALEVVPPLVQHVVDSPRCYLVPRADGRLIVGATVEQIGFRKAVTPDGILHLLRSALEIAPALTNAPITDMWSGFRPGTPDALPILGADPEIENLYYATGHYRNGILLAPLTGEVISELVTSGRTSTDLTPFGIDRFR